jgi:hypothetical protein
MLSPGPWSRCSTCCGISNTPALLLCSVRAVLPQTPTPQNRISPWDKPLRPRIHRHSRSLPGHAPRPAAPEIQTGMISVLLGHDPKAGTALQEVCFHWAAPPSPALSLPCQLCPPRPAQPCTMFTPQACASKTCKVGDPHTQDLHSTG